MWRSYDNGLQVAPQHIFRLLIKSFQFIHEFLASEMFINGCIICFCPGYFIESPERR